MRFLKIKFNTIIILGFSPNCRYKNYLTENVNRINGIIYIYIYIYIYRYYNTFYILKLKGISM